MTNWQGQLTAEEEQLVERCEKELDLKDLIRYRRQAILEIRKDFKNLNEKR